MNPSKLSPLSALPGHYWILVVVVVVVSVEKYTSVHQSCLLFLQPDQNVLEYPDWRRKWMIITPLVLQIALS